MPIEHAHVVRGPLAALPSMTIDMADTLVLPPAHPLRIDHAMRARLSALDGAAADD